MCLILSSVYETKAGQCLKSIKTQGTGPFASKARPCHKPIKQGARQPPAEFKNTIHTSPHAPQHSKKSSSVNKEVFCRQSFKEQ
jgi:hypothetical protein